MCKPKAKRIEQKVAQDINHHRNQHINQAVGEKNKGKEVLTNQEIYQQINNHLNQRINQNVKKMVPQLNPSLYRLHEIHKIEKELQEERLKHSAKLLHWLPFDF